MAEKLIHENQWSQCLQIIANNVNEQQYKTWFAPIRFVSFDEKTCTVTLGVPSRFFVEWLEEHYAQLMAAVLKRVFGAGLKLMYRSLDDATHDIYTDIQSAPVANTPKRATERTADIQRLPDSIAGTSKALPTFDSHLNPQLSFDCFIEGDSNKMPLAVARSVAENPDQQCFNPMFIYGHSGVGKTHLANAIGLLCKQLHPQKRVLYVSAHLFQVQYVNAQMRDNKLNDFIHFYQNIDLLIVDDVQEFQGMKGTLGTFFQIFNHLRMNGKQIVLTCDRPPIELRDMEERMLTRFKWGLQCEIEKPTQTLRYNILKDKIRRDGLVIADDVVRFIAKNVSDSVRDLEGIVNSLLAHSLCLGREIDKSLAEQIVKRAVRIERQPVTIDRIIQSVCGSFNVSVDDLHSSCRRADVAHARQVVMYLATRMTDLSSTKIGLLVGKRSHATVLHSVKQTEAMMVGNPALREQVEEIRGSLLSRV